jgi:hypothetical protein
MLDTSWRRPETKPPTEWTKELTSVVWDDGGTVTATGALYSENPTVTVVAVVD